MELFDEAHLGHTMEGCRAKLHLGKLYACQGRFDLAEPLYHTALDCFEEARPDPRPHAPETRDPRPHAPE